MRWPLAVLAMAAILAAFALYVLIVYRLYQRLQRRMRDRGYKSAAVLTGAGAFSFLLTFASMWPIVRATGPEDALPWLLALFPGVPLVLIPFVRLLPRRDARAPGRRVIRFPYRVFGLMLLIVFAPAIWIAAIAVNKAGLAQAGTLCAAGGLACLAIARRSRAPDATTALAADPRPPVVYLRPFGQEQEPFAALSDGWRGYWSELRRSIRTREKWWFKTLEGYLMAEITSRIGPFVALGNPADFVPPEHAAARLYVADAQWTQQFDTLVRHAAAMLLVAGVSPNVAWELRRIRELGLERRLFVLTRHRRAAWRDFAKLLREAGFTDCGDDPGPASIVGFESGGRMVVLKRNCRSAAETVKALAIRLCSGPREDVSLV